MQKFFYPRSVAVVGVSEDPANLAQGIVANLLHFKYQGKIFLVGRRPGTTYGLPIFPRLSDLPEPVDLAAILAPARVVPALVRECGELGISRVVVESAGFSELNDAGIALGDEVRAALRQYGIRLVGPNGLGLVNLEIGLALPFAQIGSRIHPGRISIIAQSGGVATHVLAWMTKEGLGLNKFLSLGNKLDVSENEVLEYLLEDPGTAAIYVYLEGMDDGRGLLAVAAKATKPIYLHLANVGPETATIAHSHTASLTTDERVLEAACRQSRIIRVKTQAEFLNAVKLVDQPPVRGNRLVVFSRSGGEAVVTAYACRRFGFTLPPLSQALVHSIQSRSRAGVIHPTNPIDLGDIFDFAVYTDIMAAVCRDPEVDAVLFHYGPMADFERETAREMARRMLELAREAQKPLAITVLCTPDEEDYLRDTLGVPVFHFPEDAVQALALSRDLAARGEILSPPALAPFAGGRGHCRDPDGPQPGGVCPPGPGPHRDRGPGPGPGPLGRGRHPGGGHGRGRPPGVPGGAQALGPQPDSQNRGRRGGAELAGCGRGASKPLPGWPRWPGATCRPRRPGRWWSCPRWPGASNCFWGPAGMTPSAPWWPSAPAASTPKSWTTLPSG